MMGPKTVMVLQNASKTKSSMGGDTTAYEDVAVITEGLLQPLSPSERVYGDKMTVFADNRYICDKTAITEMASDYIIEGNRMRHNTIYYRIQGVNDMGRTWEFDLLRVK